MLILAVYSIKDLLDLNETSYRICQDKRLPEHLEAIRALVPVSGGFILFLCSTHVQMQKLKEQFILLMVWLFFNFIVKGILFQILQLQEASNRLMDALPQNFVIFIEIKKKNWSLIFIHAINSTKYHEKSKQ